MKRIALYSFLALGLPAWAGAASNPYNTFAWERLPAYNAYQLVIGSATATQGGDATITAATYYVTLPLTIPDDTAYAEVNVRNGTSIANIASASNIAGATNFDLQAGLFTRKDDADYYINHHHNLTLPSYYVPFEDTAGIVYKAAFNDRTTLFATLGTYHLPVRSGFLLLRFLTPAAADTQVINDTGVTITVKFARDGR